MPPLRLFNSHSLTCLHPNLYHETCAGSVCFRSLASPNARRMLPDLHVPETGLSEWKNEPSPQLSTARFGTTEGLKCASTGLYYSHWFRLISEFIRGSGATENPIGKWNLGGECVDRASGLHYSVCTPPVRVSLGRRPYSDMGASRFLYGYSSSMMPGA